MAELSPYDEWNQTLIDLLFNTDRADRPVYLDLDEVTTSALARALGVAETEVLDALAAVVTARLRLYPSHRSVFLTYIDDLRTWRAARAALDGPPVVALLAFLTLAARAMGEDSDFAPHAYYPRLHRLLGVTDPAMQEKVTHDYRECAETLWQALNDWLTRADGRLGLPTAYAITHRYVGLPMSQALVRAADRQRFARMFRELGLHPGADLPPESLIPLIDEWVRQQPSPASRHLQTMWASQATRDRIAAVAAIELLHWDGVLDEHEDYGSSARSGSIRLQGLLMRFPRPSLELSFIADFGSAAPAALEIVSAEGTPELDVVPIAGGRVRPRSASVLDSTSLIEGMLQVRDPVSGREASRLPRRVVPLRRDELLNVYVESERVQLGEDIVLLAKDDSALRNKLTAVLSQISRPGFKVRDDLPGVPAGWLLVTDVQIMSKPSSDPGNDLNVLVPLVASQITLAGGLKLPGRVRKWSSLRPPEIRAAVSDTDLLEVRLVGLDSVENEPATFTWTSREPALVVDLGPVALDDGDYELSLVSQGRVVQQTVLRLRSADTPDVAAWEVAPFLVHSAADPMSILTAALPLDGSDDVVEGPYAPLAADRRRVGVAAEKEAWWTASPPSEPVSTAMTITRPDTTSCVTTGAHYIELPTYQGRPTSPFVKGTCATCGVVKRYPAWWSRRREHEFRRGGSRSAAPTFDVGQLPEITDGSSGWSDAVDALVHVGGGAYSQLERVALQVEGSSLFVDTFTRALEHLGHIEVQRDARLEPDQWCMAPAYLAQLVGGGFLLTGKWQPRVLAALAESAAEVGGRLRRESSSTGPDTFILDDVDDATANNLAVVWGVGVVSEGGPAGPAMLRTLPSLGELAFALPRIPIPGARRIRRFDPFSASWCAVPFADVPGAYRLDSSFASIDLYRDEHDVAAGEGAAGTVHLIKHLEARRIGRPLIAYDRETRQLAVPLGADLPGLYGRAATLCSGRPPTSLPSRRCLVYRDVPPGFAENLVALLVA